MCVFIIKLGKEHKWYFYGEKIFLGEKSNKKDLAEADESQHTVCSHLPSRSPIHPTVNEEIMPPMANMETERDQYMVRMCGEVVRSSLVSASGVSVPLVPAQGCVLGTVPSSPEALVAYLLREAIPSTRL